MMNQAWDRKCNVSKQDFELRAKNLISHCFVEIENKYVAFCREKGSEYKDEVFYIFQRLIVYLTLSDGDFLQQEYDAYKVYCSWAHINALSVEECKTLYSRTSTDVIINDLKLIDGLRDSINGENYSSMVLGFCYMSLMGDKSFDENEYYILRCFFRSGYDYCPQTWEQFKREWK